MNTLASGGDGSFAAYAADHGLHQNSPNAPSPVLPENPAPRQHHGGHCPRLDHQLRLAELRCGLAYAQAAHEWGKKIGE